MARGGRRLGAGRKRLAAKPLVPHRARPLHDRRHPMHITLRRVAGLPSFRQQRVGAIMSQQMKRLNDGRFQIVHFSIQSNHVHLIVEAVDRVTITKKMAGFAISFAKRLNNKVLGGRRGKVWVDRYHRHDVKDAPAMKSVLRYVFGNAKKHGEIARDALVLDPYSTAWTFDGWDIPVPIPLGVEHWPRPRARTRLLRKDWIAWGGLLRVADAPNDPARPGDRSARTP